MSFKTRLKADNKRILTEDQDLLLLTNADGVSQTGLGQWTNPGLSYTPENQPIAGRKMTIGFHIDVFDLITGTDELYKGWKAEFINSEGETMIGHFVNPMIDKTYGYVRTTLTKDKAGL